MWPRVFLNKTQYLYFKIFQNIPNTDFTLSEAGKQGREERCGGWSVLGAVLFPGLLSELQTVLETAGVSVSPPLPPLPLPPLPPRPPLPLLSLLHRCPRAALGEPFPPLPGGLMGLLSLPQLNLLQELGLLHHPPRLVRRYLGDLLLVHYRVLPVLCGHVDVGKTLQTMQTQYGCLVRTIVPPERTNTHLLIQLLLEKLC